MAQSPSYLSQLPAELRGELLHYALYGTGYPDVPALANTIFSMQEKITPDKLVTIFESLPSVIALDLAQHLKNIPVMNNPAVADWVANAPIQLINGPALFNAAARGSLETVKNLLANKNTNVNWRNKTEQSQQYSLTPLLRVVSLAFREKIVAEIVDLLLKAGANPNLASQTKPKAGNKDDWTPLMAAAGKGNEQVVTMLLKAKANVDAQDIYGDTALIEAAKRGHKEIVQILLEAGANLRIMNNQGETAHSITMRPDIKQQLLDAAMPRIK